MATTLQARIAPRRRTGGEESQQRDGHRAEQAVARAGLGRKAKQQRIGEWRKAAAVTGVTVAAFCIPAAGWEGA